jgi:hypothetical protein
MTKAIFMQQNRKEGEEYAGIILGLNGEPDYHLFLLPGEADRAPWKKQVDWAISVGGSLPTRREQSVLLANCKASLKTEWYWSGEQDASNSNYAWVQNFINGSQCGDRKSASGRARAVRRVYINK